MTNRSRGNFALILLTLVSIVLDVLPLIVWIKVFNANAAATQQQKQKLFLQRIHFSSLNTVSYLELLVAGVAIVASAIWRKKSAAIERILATIALIISCLLLALFLFQLM